MHSLLLLQYVALLRYLLKSIPNLKTAIFSRLGPHTTLKKHKGWAGLSNHVLRCHMGIEVPIGKSGISVEDSFRYVRKAKWVVFDDSKDHSGINETDEYRTVLLLDIDRPWWVKNGQSDIPDTPEMKKFIEKFTN